MTSTANTFKARWRSAIHEAGHEAVAEAIGVPVTRGAHLTPDGGGEVRTGFPASGEALVVVALAGPAAETALIGLRPDPEAWQSDFETIAALSALSGEVDLTQHFEMAVSLVRKLRREIVTQAHGLVLASEESR